MKLSFAPKEGHRATRRASIAAAVIVAAGGVSAGVAAGATVHHRTRPHLVNAHGAVIARNLRRHTLVVASGGVARTLRLSSGRQVVASRLGTDVVARATHLADGTYRVVHLAKHGRSRRAVVRATVVKDLAGHLILSAGGSVFAIGGAPARHGAPRAHVTSTGPSTGEVVNAKLQIGSDSVQPTSIQPVGQASLVNLEGVLQSVSSGSLVVAVSAGALTTVTIPASITLPSTIARGDQVEILASYSAGTFTLVTIVDDTLAAKTTTQGVTSPTDGSTSRVEVEGLVTSISSSPPSITVQPGDGAAPVTLTLPGQIAAPAPGARVHVVATVSGSTLTVVELHVRQPEGQPTGSDSSSSSGGGGGGSNSGSGSGDHHGGDQGASGSGGALTPTATTTGGDD